MTVEKIKFPEDWPNTVWTDEDWNLAMLQKLDKWLAHPQPKPKLPKYMHMNVDGFIHWRQTGIVPKETRILYTIFPEFLNE